MGSRRGRVRGAQVRGSRSLLSTAACATALALLLTAAPGTTLGIHAADTRDLTGYVNPLSGTLGSGFPMVAASRPFGMMELGPNTGHPLMEDPVNYDGYAYGDSMIRGFALTHFDGAGIHIAGDLPFMPTTGLINTDPKRFASAFSHAQETAQPGYYAVNLLTYRTEVEMTSTARAAIVRMTYPAKVNANVLFDVSRSIPGLHPGAATIVGDRAVAGWMRSENAPSGYLLYFTAVFDRPFKAFGTWSGGTVAAGSRATAGSANGAFVTFDTTSAPVVQMRLGMSYVDAAGATANLAAEIPAGTSFNSVRAAAHDDWNRHLHDIEVAGGVGDQLQTFYSNLFRALSMPSLFDDADGRYFGFDHAVHQVEAGHHHYTSLSMWDTYRTQNPLLALIEPGVEHDVGISLLDDYDQNRQVIPRWVQAGNDDGIMGGDSGSAFVADLVMRGVLHGAEAQRAYAALIHQATTLPPVWPRSHLDAYLQKGYIPQQASDIGAALTQEYAIDDNAVLGIARALGTPADAAALRRRVDNWKNLLDPNGHYIRPRNSDGTWANPTVLGPLTVPWTPDFQDGYQEGTGWQYLWLEPHDVAGLSSALGGPKPTLKRLDTFFSQALADIPYVAPVAQQYISVFGIYYIGNQFTPANETDLQTPWYYDWLGQPWKTSQVVRAAMQTYNSRPDGMPGNDDTGTMAAWYVMASIGVYPVTPGVPAFELNSPAYESVTIHLGAPDRSFTITAPGASSVNKYIQAAALDGAAFDRAYLTQCDIHPGGRLAYTVGPNAGASWATGPLAAPPSVSDRAPRPPMSACLAGMGLAPAS